MARAAAGVTASSAFAAGGASCAFSSSPTRRTSSQISPFAVLLWS